TCSSRSSASLWSMTSADHFSLALVMVDPSLYPKAIMKLLSALRFHPFRPRHRRGNGTRDIVISIGLGKEDRIARRIGSRIGRLPGGEDHAETWPFLPRFQREFRPRQARQRSVMSTWRSSIVSSAATAKLSTSRVRQSPYRLVPKIIGATVGRQASSYSAWVSSLTRSSPSKSLPAIVFPISSSLR